MDAVVHGEPDVDDGEGAGQRVQVPDRQTSEARGPGETDEKSQHGGNQEPERPEAHPEDERHQDQRDANRQDGLANDQGHLLGVHGAVPSDPNAQPGARREVARHGPDGCDGLHDGLQLGQVAGGPHEQELWIGVIAAEILEEEILPGDGRVASLVEALDGQCGAIEDARGVLPDGGEAFGTFDDVSECAEQDRQIGSIHQGGQQRTGIFDALRDLVQIVAVQVIESEVLVEGRIPGEEDPRIALRLLPQPRGQLLGGGARVRGIVGLHHHDEVVLQVGKDLREGAVRLADAQLRGEEPIRIGVDLQDRVGDVDGSHCQQGAQCDDEPGSRPGGLHQGDCDTAESPFEAPAHGLALTPSWKPRLRPGRRGGEPALLRAS